MLNELILAAAASTPDQPAVIGPTRTLTYSDLAERAERFAAGLRARGINRFGCMVDDVADLVALLAGSSAIGAEACQYARSATTEEATTLAAHFDHEVVITDHQTGVANSVDVGELLGDATGGLLRDTPAQCPLLILTTGTTGLPKGARNDWVRLVTSHKKRVGPSDARWLLAHVPNQFAGLGVLLHCLASGATLVVPAAFQPREAVVAMKEHRVTHVSATPTFWRFVLALLGDEGAAELPLRQITMAGEAVPSALLDDVYKAFPNARVTQIYGATEFGSSVAVGDAANGLPASVLERGDDADVQFRIIDGELHVRSRIGMLGYYGMEDVGDSWRPTGDLVEVRGDRIYFCGRTTEIINVGGTKVSPLPIEDIVGRVPGVAVAHVFGRANPVSGQIVQVDVVAEPGADTRALDAAIRAACAELPDAARPRRIRFVDDLDIRDTKIARRRSDAS